MANRLGVTILVSIFGVSCGLAACGDDAANSGDEGGGAGGETPSTAGTKTGGTASGGSNSKSGSGGGGSGGVVITAGTSADGGAGGDVGSMGGASAGADTGGAGTGGAGGEGGEGGAPALVYACGNSDISHTVCSALASLGCADTPSCADCVTERASGRADIEATECGSCLAEFDRSYQCAIDGFEKGAPAEGMECIDIGDSTPDVIPDLTEDCFAYQFSAYECATYLLGEPGGDPRPCPETWPLP